MGVLSKLDAASIGAHAAFDGRVQGRRLGLERHVANAEPLREECCQVGEDVFGTAGVVQFDVGAERGERGSDGPDMDVVQSHDAADFGGGGSDHVGLEATGSAFHENGARLAEEAERAGDDEASDDKGDKGIDSAPRAEGNGSAGDDDCDRAQRIGHGFEGSAADIEIVVRVAMEET